MRNRRMSGPPHWRSNRQGGANFRFWAVQSLVSSVVRRAHAGSAVPGFEHLPPQAQLQKRIARIANMRVQQQLPNGDVGDCRDESIDGGRRRLMADGAAPGPSSAGSPSVSKLKEMERFEGDGPSAMPLKEMDRFSVWTGLLGGLVPSASPGMAGVEILGEGSCTNLLSKTNCRP